MLKSFRLVRTARYSNREANGTLGSCVDFKKGTAFIPFCTYIPNPPHVLAPRLRPCPTDNVCFMKLQPGIRMGPTGEEYLSLASVVVKKWYWFLSSIIFTPSMWCSRPLTFRWPIRKLKRFRDICTWWKRQWRGTASIVRTWWHSLTTRRRKWRILHRKIFDQRVLGAFQRCRQGCIAYVRGAKQRPCYSWRRRKSLFYSASDEERNSWLGRY